MFLKAEILICSGLTFALGHWRKHLYNAREKLLFYYYDTMAADEEEAPTERAAAAEAIDDAAVLAG